MPHTYPLMLDIADRLIVIVGGGAVAVRKAKGLIECGAKHLRCVSPEMDAEMPSSVERISARYDVRHLQGASLVFAATNDTNVNSAVVRDARARNILVNRADADESDPADFTTPARLDESGVTITVSASGNPALAAKVRDGLRSAWDPRWSQMAEAMKLLRPEILSSHAGQDSRASALRSLASDEAMNILSSGDLPALRTWIYARHPEVAPSHD